MTLDSAERAIDISDSFGLGATQSVDLTDVNDIAAAYPQGESYAALKTQSQRLERLLQVMPAGVIVIDGKGIVRQANKLALDLLGEPLEGELWRLIIARSFRPRADDGHEVSLHDGRRVKLSIAPLIDEPGQLIVLTDLTETRQLQARISHMQRLSSLGKMVASLAHQIRTPLSAALLYASNLKHKNVEADKREKFTDRLVNRLKELEAQVNDMLLFAKSGNDQVLTPLNVEQMLGQTEQCCEAMLQQASVKLETSISSAAKQATILANSNALNGALVNLVHNAVQVSAANASIHLHADIDSEGLLHIQISDAGRGIPEDQIRKIFEPFFTTKTNGTGLGLAVVQAAINAHNGKVTAANQPQGGAVFHIHLPTNLQTSNTADTAINAVLQE